MTNYTVLSNKEYAEKLEQVGALGQFVEVLPKTTIMALVVKAPTGMPGKTVYVSAEAAEKIIAHVANA